MMLCCMCLPAAIVGGFSGPHRLALSSVSSAAATTETAAAAGVSRDGQIQRTSSSRITTKSARYLFPNNTTPTRKLYNNKLSYSISALHNSNNGNEGNDEKISKKQDTLGVNGEQQQQQKQKQKQQANNNNNNNHNDSNESKLETSQQPLRLNDIVNNDATGTSVVVVKETAAATPAVAAATTTSQVTTHHHYDIRRFRCASYLLVQAASIGMLTGWSVGIFKILIDVVKNFVYTGTTSFPYNWQRILWLPMIPALGGLVVAILNRLGGGFPPGLKGVIQSVDRETFNDSETQPEHPPIATTTVAAVHPLFQQFRFLKKSLAAVVTLGTGSSLGPEGPAVEIGANLSRLIMDIFPPKAPPKYEQNQKEYALQQRRLLLACGAAAGVSAGFNAPLAGVFFVLEIVQLAFASLDSKRFKEAANQSTAYYLQSLETVPTPTLASSGSLSAILVSSVISALVCQSLLGSHLHLALKGYNMNTPLLELPLYFLLGAMSGLAGFVFTQMTKTSHAMFQGKWGPKRLRHFFERLTPLAKPAIGGLICGLVGLVFPQILFNGFDTLNIALANRMLPSLLLVQLLGIKMATTAIAAGSGLVGGTFAPSLFHGGMIGALFHNVASSIFESASHHGTSISLASPMLQISGLPAYTMVGAATVLAANFRAPLTATLLLFEMTRDYGAILPLMAGTGIASVVGDILEAKQELSMSDVIVDEPVYVEDSKKKN